MKTAHVIYTTKLRTEATHLKSGTLIITDAPTDNQGKGEAFSPTDLLATALGTCMLTIMGIRCQMRGWNMDNTGIKITKVMTSDPRRVQEVIVEFDMTSTTFTEEQRIELTDVAINCPVAKSLHTDLKQTVIFNW